MSLPDILGRFQRSIQIREAAKQFHNKRKGVGLRGQEIHRVYLDGLNLPKSDLHKAKGLLVFARNSKLMRSDFSESSLWKFVAANSDLRWSNFRRAFLPYAAFAHSDLRSCDFTDAFLEGADFTGADLTGCKFDRADLTDVRGLHDNPTFGKLILTKDPDAPAPKHSDALTPTRDTGPTVAACMIVKNEGRFLEDCLKSLQGRVDKIVVVDTGSSDDTVEIAKKHGAELRFFEWTGSFADARNESIRDIGTDWFIQIDADERLGPGDFRGDVKALDSQGLDCGLIYLHNASALKWSMDEVLRGGDARIGEWGQVPRLVRNTGGVQFTGRIHEDVSPWLQSRGMKVGFAQTPLVHYGACEEVIRLKEKGERNIEMLKARLEDEPENITLYGYLTLEMSDRMPLEDVRPWVEKGWKVVEKRPAKGTVARLVVPKVKMDLLDGKLDEAFAALELALSIEGPTTDIDFLTGLVWEETSKQPGLDIQNYRRCLAEAISCYEFALNPPPWTSKNVYCFGSDGVASMTRLGWCWFLWGNIDVAKKWMQMALEKAPGYEDTLRLKAALEYHDDAVTNTQREMQGQP